MPPLPSRRRFLRTAVTAGAALQLGDPGFLHRLPRLTAAETRVNPVQVRLRPEIEPLVRLLENTPRHRLLEQVASRIRAGTTYPELLAALFLAGVRNVQPRPVGFKFHTVLVVHSAHLAGQAAPDSDRWLPLFWALDYFKSAQDRDEQEGDWTLSPVRESAVPPPQTARRAFIEAMENWDVEAADTAVTGLTRGLGANQVFDIFCRFGARDFRDIGHKAIYVANAWRTLQVIGWQHAEPVLRSLAYALLAHEGENPARRDASADRPWRRNLEGSHQLRTDWLAGRPDPQVSGELLASLRTLSDAEAATQVVDLVNHGIAVETVWDGLFGAAMELLMRRPGIRSLHAVTSINALHFAFQHCGDEETRRMLLLQNAAFLPLFRGAAPLRPNLGLDGMEPAVDDSGKAPDLESIFAEVSRNKRRAAAQSLAFLDQGGDPEAYLHAARRFLFLRGRDAHDYKFTSAVLEDYHRIAPAWRNRFLAGSVFNLRGSGGEETDLVRRTRAALL